MRFDAFLGNDALRAQLSAACEAGKLPHCIALCGPEGSGKRTLARILAAAMQCQAEGEKPCGVCPACRKVFAGNHPDVIVCEDHEHKLFGVGPARDVAADACIRPNEGRSKVYLFLQEMNPQAQNALLKLIEEPPAYAAFLFLTPDLEGLLPTVQSRCQIFHLAPLDEQTMLGALRERVPGRTEAEYRTAAAEQWLGRAMQALEQIHMSERTDRFASACAKRDRLVMTELLSGMEKLGRDEFCGEITIWMQLLHQALRASAGLPASKQARAVADACTGRELMRALERLGRAYEYAQSNVGVGHLCGALRSLF